MNLAVIGSGYVGTTHAACFAEMGHDVLAVDIDTDIVASINAGEAPLHEPGLDELVARHAGDRLRATTDYDDLTGEDGHPEVDAAFVCVQTPTTDEGQDLSAYRAATRSLGELLAANDPGDPKGETLVVSKSTVLPGTTEGELAPLLEEVAGREVPVANNPEFLAEGTAVEDFWDPDKVVFGTTSEWASERLHSVYDPLLEGEDPPAVVDVTPTEAETIKYANNTFLAAKVSLVNELGNVCKELGVDAYEVLDAVGLDDRIGSRFMRSGLGWGGSCFPKDVDALRGAARDRGYDPSLLDAVVEVNDKQPRRMVALLEQHVDPEGARIAVLGLSFKPGTDDVRGSRALDVMDLLEDRDAEIVAYDPEAMDHVRPDYPGVEFASNASQALADADAAMVCTGWPEFDALDFSGMARSVVVDGRRIGVDRDALDVYEGLCW